MQIKAPIYSKNRYNIIGEYNIYRVKKLSSFASKSLDKKIRWRKWIIITIQFWIKIEKILKNSTQRRFAELIVSPFEGKLWFFPRIDGMVLIARSYWSSGNGIRLTTRNHIFALYQPLSSNHILQNHFCLIWVDFLLTHVTLIITSIFLTCFQSKLEGLHDMRERKTLIIIYNELFWFST